MYAVRTIKRGFTLIEILIVVIILGILAAIVIPQFSNASNDARKSNLQSTVQTLRSQIQLYKLQHGDTPPDLVANWTPMINTSSYGTATEPWPLHAERPRSTRYPDRGQRVDGCGRETIRPRPTLLADMSMTTPPATALARSGALTIPARLSPPKLA